LVLLTLTCAKKKGVSRAKKPGKAGQVKVLKKSWGVLGGKLKIPKNIKRHKRSGGAQNFTKGAKTKVG